MSSIYYFGSYLILPFSKDEAVVRISWKTLSLIGFSYAFQGLTLLAVSSFNSLGKPLPSFVLTMLKTLVALIPACWILEMNFGLDGIYYGISGINILVGLLSFYLMIMFLSRNIHSSNKAEI